MPRLRRLLGAGRRAVPPARARRAAARTPSSCRASAARSRFPYYMDTYGMHSIHGRAPAIATGIAVSRPDLDVWVVTGDGDGLSIGGNHLIHALRRNVNLTILLFNNQIYGLTKGQYSPTSELGKVTKSTPFGSIDHPFNPVSLAIGSEASFVARTHDMDRKHMMEVFRRAHDHKGAAFVEIYQNCNVFNDGAFEAVTAKDNRADMMIDVKHGQPIRFGQGQATRASWPTGSASSRSSTSPRSGRTQLLVHDETRPDPTLAFALSRLADSPTAADADGRVPGGRAAGVRRRPERPDRRRPGAPGPRRPRGPAGFGLHLGGLTGRCPGAAGVYPAS